jgi:phage terminase large subunit
MPKELIIEVPPKLKPIFSSQHRFIDIYGGRGSAKSWTVADFLLIKGYQKKKRNLCVREIQKSIKDSVYKLLSDRIQDHKLDTFYKITDNSIVGRNGTEFIFEGLYRNINNIKSKEGINYCWVEEAQSISRKSLEILIPTVLRQDDSQVIFTYNPTDKDDPVHVDYTLSNKPDVLKIECNYDDNPFLPIALRNEMEWDRANDIDKFYHVWQGQCVQHSEAQIFYGKWKIEDFEKWDIIDGQHQQTFPPQKTFFYFGSDFGYGQDPATLNRCFVLDNFLYIDYEFHGMKTDIDQLPGYYGTIPESKNYPITGDSSRPDTIAYIRARGFPKIKSSIKGKGSIEDGVAFMRSFDKIIIHPRCKHTIDEFRLYSYIIDPKTGQISSKIEDKHNHHIDNLRYAVEDLMRIRQVQATKGIWR